MRCKRSKLGKGDGKWYIHPDFKSTPCIAYCFGVGYDISFDIGLTERFGA